MSTCRIQSLGRGVKKGICSQQGPIRMDIHPRQRESKGMGEDGFKGSKGDPGQIQMEHLWKVKTAEVSRNLRAGTGPHVPTVIVDRLRLWIKLLLPTM